MPLRRFLTHLDFDEYQTLRICMLPLQENVLLHWLCILHTLPHMCIFMSSHALHLDTMCTHPCYSCHSLVCILFPYPQHIMFILCFVALCFKVFCLFFELHFLIHLVPHMHPYPCSYTHFFPSYFLTPLSIRVKKGQSIVLENLLDSCAHSQGEKFHKGDAYTKGKKTSLQYFWQVRLGGTFQYPCIPTYSLLDHFSLEGHKEVFISSSLIFLFDNTSWYYLVFAYLFPYFLCFIFIVYCICLCIREQF